MFINLTPIPVAPTNTLFSFMPDPDEKMFHTDNSGVVAFLSAEEEETEYSLLTIANCGSSFGRLEFYEYTDAIIIQISNVPDNLPDFDLPIYSLEIEVDTFSESIYNAFENFFQKFEGGLFQDENGALVLYGKHGDTLLLMMREFEIEFEKGDERYYMFEELYYNLINIAKNEFNM